MGKIRSQNTTSANGKLPFKIKILLIAILPMIAVSVLTGAIIHNEATKLIAAETKLIEKRILQSKQRELKNYISLALTAINHEYANEAKDRREAQQAVMRILNELNFSEDGYFFAYDRSGTSLVNPKTPGVVGGNLWYLKDEGGNFVIQELMQKAVAGGGFHTYIWNKPTTSQQSRKLGYASYLPKWGWMFGTGLYLDDIEKEVAAFENDMQSAIRKAEAILFLVSLLAVLIATIGIGAIHYNEHKLADSRLKDLTRRIVDVQEEERKRVSHDLHDGINQLLVTIRHRLEMAIDYVGQPDKSKPLMEKSLSILDTSISDVRRLSKALHPSALDNMGLAAAIRELGREFEESTRIETIISTTPVGNKLDESSKIALYRVVQEALTNIARHADATKVTLELKVDERQKLIGLKITDNGIGLENPDDPKSCQGLGIRNMHERMESHDGSLVIRNGIDGGLELFAAIPQS